MIVGSYCLARPTYPVQNGGFDVWGKPWENNKLPHDLLCIYLEVPETEFEKIISMWVAIGGETWDRGQNMNDWLEIMELSRAGTS